MPEQDMSPSRIYVFCAFALLILEVYSALKDACPDGVNDVLPVNDNRRGHSAVATAIIIL
jgi:hypothetical protein